MASFPCHSNSSAHVSNNEYKCSVCFHLFAALDRSIATLSCDHKVCKACGDLSVPQDNAQCPICRMLNLFLSPSVKKSSVDLNDNLKRAKSPNNSSSVETTSFFNQPYQHKNINEAGFLQPTLNVANDQGIRFVYHDPGFAFIRQIDNYFYNKTNYKAD